MDLIDRQAVLDMAYAYGNGLEPEGYCVNVEDIQALPSAQPELSTEIQEILNYLDTTLHPIVSPDNWNVYSELHDMVSKLPSAQLERDIPIKPIETTDKA